MMLKSKVSLRLLIKLGTWGWEKGLLCHVLSYCKKRIIGAVEILQFHCT